MIDCMLWGGRYNGILVKYVDGLLYIGVTWISLRLGSLIWFPKEIYTYIK